MKNKFIICLTAVLCAASFFTACGGNDSSQNTAERESSLSESSYKITAPSLNLKKYGNEAKTIVTLKPRKGGKIEAPKSSDKCFLLNETLILLKLETGWKIASGGNATDNQTDNITSYPAVIQYEDTKNTITVNLVDGCEDQEAFLAGTKESYLEAYGNEFDSIDITDFEQISIKNVDSFKIVANVIIGGEEYEMTHIISNDLYNKTLSWMMLDNDGSLKDIDLVDKLNYPNMIRKEDLPDIRMRDFDSDVRYRWDNDKKEAVPVE